MSVVEVGCNECVYVGCCKKLWLLGNECGSWMLLCNERRVEKKMYEGMKRKRRREGWSFIIKPKSANFGTKVA